MQYTTSRNWYDTRCTLNNRFVCEKDIIDPGIRIKLDIDAINTAEAILKEQLEKENARLAEEARRKAVEEAKRKAAAEAAERAARKAA